MSANRPLTNNFKTSRREVILLRSSSLREISRFAFKKLRRAIQFRRRLVINRDDEELIEEWRKQLGVSRNISKRYQVLNIDYILRNRKTRGLRTSETENKYINSVSLPFDMPLGVMGERVILPNSYEICLGFIHSPDLKFVNFKINGRDTNIPHKTFSWSDNQVFTALYSHNLTMGVHCCREAIFCDAEGDIIDIENGDVKGVFCFINGVFNNIMKVDKVVFERYYRNYCQNQAVRTIQKWYKSCKNRENLTGIFDESPPSYEELYGSG